MRTFWDFLVEHGGHSGSKFPLMPSLASQYYHYPPSDIITWSADAITYMDDEDLEFKFLYKPYFTPTIRKTIGDFGKNLKIKEG